MKKLSMLVMLLLAMTIESHVFAQSVSIPLMPGWTWISYPSTDTVDFATAFGSFTPAEGDIIESQFDYSEYIEGCWLGGTQQFYPGYGYLYYSNRTAPVILTFNVQPIAPQVTVTTAVPTSITTTSAVCGGTVTLGMGNHIFARGVCWGMERMPNIDGNHTSDEAVSGSFSVMLQELEPNTTYFIRAYAVSDQGLFYGEELNFATPPIGAINSLFSVSDSKQVYFSQGNLQYIGSASTPYWRFADNQWDYLGDNGQGSTNQNVNRDLFGWGTSGYNHGAICYQPWSTSTNHVDYNPYGSSYANLYDQTGQADWGYNAISNGGNLENQWRTLSYSEWNYLLDTRITASGIRFAMAQVNNVNGVILLPDNWNESIYQLNNTNLHGANFNSNIITASEWNSMETSGAVFLPVAGKRNGTSIGDANRGYYWTSISSGESGASALLIEDGFVATGFTFRSYGYAIRLVHNLSASLPEVSTLEPTNISITTATVGGVVYNNGGNAITECGICWSTEQNPTIEGNHIIAEGVTSGEFSIDLVNLIPDTTYYVRAYASNDHAIVYGIEMSFTTSEGSGSGGALIGAINGLFSVSDSQQVYFSQGNLQYIGSATPPYWKFADNQWDYFGTTTGQDSSSPNVDRDLFGWGTSGYNHGANCFQPWSTSDSYSDYYAYGNYQYNLYSQTGKADWGYNPISNGGNQENQWRSLTSSEWFYVFNTRTTTSGIHFAKAKVNDVNGVVLLPDDWSTSYYNLSNTNSAVASFNSNIITATQWATLELHGAVFLPAAGSRYGTSLSYVGNDGHYWSASSYDSNYVYLMGFDNGFLYTLYRSFHDNGYSVRLVRVAQ